MPHGLCIMDLRQLTVEFACVVAWSALSAVVVPAQSGAASPMTAGGQASKPDRLNLAADPRFRALVTLDRADPTLMQVLDSVEAATGVHLSVDQKLEKHEPAFGHVQMRNAPAWLMMNFVAKTQLVDGHWEKVDNGYRLTATASLRERKAEPPAPALRPDQADPYHLARDPRLTVPVTMVLERAELREVLQGLREATGVTLTLDKRLERHDPELGSLEMRKAPAWTIMKLVAQKQLDDGRWEKDGDGYRLVANASLHEKPLPAPAWKRPLVVALGISLLVAGFLVIVRWSRLPRGAGHNLKSGAASRSGRA